MWHQTADECKVACTSENLDARHRWDPLPVRETMAPATHLGSFLGNGTVTNSDDGEAAATGFNVGEVVSPANLDILERAEEAVDFAGHGGARVCRRYRCRKPRTA